MAGDLCHQPKFAQRDCVADWFDALVNRRFFPEWHHGDLPSAHAWESTDMAALDVPLLARRHSYW
jgi:hypothetical protein